MKIGILHTGHAPDEVLDDLGDYDAMFIKLLEGKGFTYQTWNVVDMDFPADVNAADGWLVSGSKHGAYEDHPFIPPLEDFIRAAYDAEVPTVGVCFGHQIIAQALGGKVEKFKGGWTIGPQTYDWGGTPWALNAWHQDQVVERPAKATDHAGNEFCENAILVYGDRAFTMQPHPEFRKPMMDALVDYRAKGLIPNQQIALATQGMDAANDDEKMADMIAKFFKTREVA